MKNKDKNKHKNIKVPLGSFQDIPNGFGAVLLILGEEFTEG